MKNIITIILTATLENCDGKQMFSILHLELSDLPIVDTLCGTPCISVYYQVELDCLSHSKN